jgi:Zn-dependent peptidase ImmA (M78 family)
MSTEKQDAEANHFAMCLLMPKNLVFKEVQKMGGIDLCDDAPLKELAKKFGVSVAMMAVRLGQLYPKLKGL